jgi:AcrR family transcriptional regulator
VPPRVKSRRYTSPKRQAQARETRQRILTAAQQLFATDGYPSTTVAAIAAQAQVSVDTVYTAVGRKPQVVLAVIDNMLGGSSADERDYVSEIRAEPTAAGKLNRYARAVAEVVPTVAPLQEALRKAGETDPDCARAWHSLVERRARNMLDFAADLRATGGLRPDISDQEVADIVWATNAAEFWALLAQRGWHPEAYAGLLDQMWRRLFLDVSG